jgi:hypothetical protein
MSDDAAEIVWLRHRFKQRSVHENQVVSQLLYVPRLYHQEDRVTSSEDLRDMEFTCQKLCFRSLYRVIGQPFEMLSGDPASDPASFLLPTP